MIFSISLLTACNDEEMSPAEELEPEKEKIIAYFQEIALGFEIGDASRITRKWQQEMRILVYGEKDPDLMSELDLIISEINQLATDGFKISLATDSTDFNYFLFLGPAPEFQQYVPVVASSLEHNWGLFYIYWDASQQINRGSMYIDLERATDPDIRKHLLREELTQSLGLGNDSPRYSDSIFQENWTRTTSYTDLDQQVIKLLYHPDMTTGLNAFQVEKVLREILYQ
ncbi:MAG: DUF2927 domain-containing protein [Candidatus Cyclobacteriaceae bacterium M3_2C_046]